MELGKEEDFGDEAVVSATSGISSVSPIQQELSFTSTPAEAFSNENINKTSSVQICREEMEKMLENCRNKRTQRKLPKGTDQ